MADAKRLIDRRFNDEIVQKDMKLSPLYTNMESRHIPKIHLLFKKNYLHFWTQFRLKITSRTKML